MRPWSFIIGALFVFSAQAQIDVAKEAEAFDFNVKMIDMERADEDRLLDSLQMVREIVSSEEFKLAVLKHRHWGKKRFANNKGLSNSQVYARIITGAERLKPMQDQTMDLELELYSDLESNTVAKTWSGSSRIFMNTKFFRRCHSKVAGTLVHEWLHKLGFAHDVDNTRRRKSSVPYAVGSIITKLAEKRIGRHRH